MEVIGRKENRRVHLEKRRKEQAKEEEKLQKELDTIRSKAAYQQKLLDESKSLEALEAELEQKERALGGRVPGVQTPRW